MKKRILYIVPHRLNRSPGQRFRCEQYLAFLEAEGFEICYSNLLSEREDKLFYQPGKLFQKLLIFIKSLFLRSYDVVRANRYDIVFIYREAIMVGTTFFERALKRTRAKIIFDFDDSIWLNDTSDGNQSLRWLKRPSKTATICKLADLVIVGNEYLANYARQFSKNVVIIPTTIDTNYHTNPQGYRTTEPVCIGWTGTSTTLKHFENIIPVLKILKQRYQDRIYFKIIHNGVFEDPELDIKSTQWSLENEISDLLEIGIGIMPLPFDEWSQGKCGFKGLQYMSLGIPTIMSPYGVNKEIITDGQNGFLAITETEWLEKLCYLIDNSSARETLGQQGKLTVEEKYSINSQKYLYISLFKNVITQ